MRTRVPLDWLKLDSLTETLHMLGGLSAAEDGYPSHANLYQ